MKRPSRRRFIKVIVFLLLGAAVNVAVAWGCQMLPQGISDSRYMDPEIVAWFGRSAPPPPSATWFIDNTVRYKAIGARTTHVVAQSPWDEDWSPSRDRRDMRGTIAAYHFEAGWPWYSLEGTLWQTYENLQDRTFTPVVIVSDALHTPQPDFNTFMNEENFPLRPLWPGFAINTLFYAGVLWVMFCGPSTLRRMIRRRRGRCPACAYPVGSSAVCTECGLALSLRRGAAIAKR